MGLRGEPRNRLRVLAYRGRVRAAELERQLAQLVPLHPVVSVARVLDTFEGGHALPPGALLLAFHETAGFAAEVWPVLRRNGCAAVLFLAPGAGTSEPERAELERLAREGVALGLRLEGRAPASGAATEVRAALAALERLQPGLARLLAYPEGTPDEARVEAARAAGVELGFSTLAGANDLGRCDRLRLGTLGTDSAAEPAELGARLAACGADSAATGVGRSGARELRARRVRLRFVYRPLDAVLTAAERPRSGLRGALRALAPGRRPHYERLRGLVQLATLPLPALERALRRALLDTTRLPLRVEGLELAGHGSAATVFRLDAPGVTPPHVLKLYRWTLGLPGPLLAQMARRHRARYEQLCAWFGAHVQRTHFLVLHGPLRGLAAAACLQERAEGATDLLALSDGEILRLVRARPGLSAEFAGFARRVLGVRAQGFFPDLIGPGNLLLLADGAEPRLRLIDYGLFDLRTGTAHLPLDALDAATRRFEALAAELER